MKIVTIVGARPQFVKAAVVSRELQENYPNVLEIIVHTGQHYDKNMSDIFFDQMDIPKPDYNLGIGGGTHGQNTGRMLEAIEAVLNKERPDWVLVYGDTDSTLAGALAAAKLHIPIAHVEAGLRSFKRNMPEEINRVLTDRLSSVLYCPTSSAVNNLKREGYGSLDYKVILSGDIMLDAAQYYGDRAVKPNIPLGGKYVLSTIHREENISNINRLSGIISALNVINEETEVVLPLHPRTAEVIRQNRLDVGFETISPVGYLEMVYLIKNSSMILTDSGGLQKEAFFFSKRCIVLREETEWDGLIENNYCALVGATKESILKAYRENKFNTNYSADLFGNGCARKIILRQLVGGS